MGFFMVLGEYYNIFLSKNSNSEGGAFVRGNMVAVSRSHPKLSIESMLRVHSYYTIHSISNSMVDLIEIFSIGSIIFVMNAY